MQSTVGKGIGAVAPHTARSSAPLAGLRRPKSSLEKGELAAPASTLHALSGVRGGA
jgi:hypothetical protein